MGIDKHEPRQKEINSPKRLITQSPAEKRGFFCRFKQTEIVNFCLKINKHKPHSLLKFVCKKEIRFTEKFFHIGKESISFLYLSVTKTVPYGTVFACQEITRVYKKKAPDNTRCPFQEVYRKLTPNCTFPTNGICPGGSS